MVGAIACFGELLLRMTAPGRELLLQRPHLDVHIGGAEANVAVGLASLGHRTKSISIVPANALGEAAIGYLRRYGVDASAVTAAPGRMGLYFLATGAGLRASEIVYDREASSFAQAAPGDFNWDELLSGVTLLHMSGITPALGPQSADMWSRVTPESSSSQLKSPGVTLLHMSGITPALGPQSADIAVAAAEAAQRLGVPISFDGNYRAQLWERWDSKPREILTRLVSKAQILFGNHRDISLLLGTKFSGDGPDRRREASQAAFDAFSNLQTIASTARHVVDADTHRISARVDQRDGAAQTEEVTVAGIVDRIGGGDAFAAGVLHGLLSGRDLDWTAGSSLAVTALKHSLPGDASLFGPRDIDSFLAGELDVRR